MPENDTCWSGLERRHPSPEIIAIHEQLVDLKRSNADLSEIIKLHVAKSADIEPVLIELVSLWRASKILGGLIAALAATVAGLWAIILWAKDHVKL